MMDGLLDMMCKKTGMSREEVMNMASDAGKAEMSSMMPKDMPASMMPGGHTCPVVWSFEKMCLFVNKNRKVPMVLWELGVRLERVSAKIIPNTPEWLCTYRVDPQCRSSQEILHWSMTPPYNPIMGTDHMKTKFGKTYAWSIPTPRIMDYLVAMKCSFVSIGAGMGYLEGELRRQKCVVHAYDVKMEAPESMWTEVLCGGPEKIEKHRDSVLILCYPPQVGHPGAKMSEECVKHYKGRDIIYIGEDLHETEIGSTGTVELTAALRLDGYKIVKQLSCLQFPHIFDKMFHYRR